MLCNKCMLYYNLLMRWALQPLIQHLIHPHPTSITSHPHPASHPTRTPGLRYKIPVFSDPAPGKP